MWTPPALEVYRSCLLLLLNYDADFRISGALGCGGLRLGIGFRAYGMGPLQIVRGELVGNEDMGYCCDPKP